ncbi:filamin-A-interacting protein 1 [Amyelois transitella]|uniref:filamin-A-interacting protein 1 n=1 Tax=Amyelois transitella TaxID=680683 RepID=UPI00299065F0|nr:filamin-A-interacting protein 1 [Amyelois transitella]
MQDSVESRGGVKCRIPQRLPPNRTKTALIRTKTQNNDTLPRPKSANRAKDDTVSRQPLAVTHRTMRFEKDRLQRPSTIPKRVNETVINKTRQIITVPVAAKAHGRTSNKNAHDLPDQETIKKCEELEVRQSEFGYGDDLESITSPSDRAMQLKIKWEEKLIHFEKLKSELVGRQRYLLEVYACLRDIHQKMSVFGQKAILPPADDLRIMNVSNLSPGQLLQLCANSDGQVQEQDVQRLAQTPLLNVNKLYNLPSKLVTNCEQTLTKRKEIIDWFETLRRQEKCISMSKLSKKLNEFNAENEMLSCNLNQIKTEFYNELNEIVDIIRKSMNETIALQLRAEEWICALSEMNAKNEELRKQLQTADHLKSQHNKYRVEELEKELKEEKCKKMVMRERLLRAEGQVKINIERASQLEATLEQSRAQNRTLERKVQHLHEQNQKVQADFDKELSKLTESIKENTAHLEDIADARGKLQAEKEQLEKRIEELSAYYNESLENLKSEMNTNVIKLIETNERYQLEINEKKKLEDKISSLCAQLLESELKCKDLQKKIQDNEEMSSNAHNWQEELESTQVALHIAKHEIEDYHNKLETYNERIKELEQMNNESQLLQESLKSDLISKEECIKELQQNKIQLEQQISDKQYKLNSYEEQLAALRNQLSRLQEDFGDFENISDLCEMVNQQKEKLLEASRQKEELVQLLQNKDLELERQTENLAQKDLLLEKKNDIIKMLSGQDDEQAKIINMLRNNLELRTHADSELKQQLVKKNTEIDKLITSLETRKQQITEFEKIIVTLEDQRHKANVQISQLETIILSLEDQSQKVNAQKRKDQEKIAVLESKIQEYESFYISKKRQQDIDAPSDNLDNLIKILENELGMPIETHSNLQDREYMRNINNCIDRKNRNTYERVDGEPPLYTENISVPTNTVIRHFGKHAPHLASNADEYVGDNLDRKKAITSIETQKEIGVKVYGKSPVDKDFKPFKGAMPEISPKVNILSRNLGLFSHDKLQEDKKYKMFKLAGHRL